MANKILDALLGQDASALQGLPDGAVQQARAFARDPSSLDLAQLEALPEPLALAVVDAVAQKRDVSTADALTSSKNKAIAKAAKKVLYVLRSQGVAVPEKKVEPSAPAAQPAAEEPLPSLVSAITGTGERALIIGRPVRGRVETLQVVIADEHGVVHLGLNEISRGQYKKMLKDAHRPGAPSAIELPLEQGKELLGEAAGTNLRTHTPFPEGLEPAMRHLGISPWASPRELPPVEEQDQGLAVNGGSLHDFPELAQWLPPVDEIRSLGLKGQEIATSALYIDEAQRAEQLRRTLTSIAEAFAQQHGQLYGRRLWLMADFLERTGRAEAANVARAEARRLFHRAPGMLSPFILRMFEKVLALSGPRPNAPAMPPPPKPQAQEPAHEKRSPGGLILP